MWAGLCGLYRRRHGGHASGDWGGKACAAYLFPRILATYLVASPASTMTVSTSPAPARRNPAAWLYSAEVKQATPCYKVGNSITTKRWDLSGPPMIWKRPPRASTFPPHLAMMRGTRPVCRLYSPGSLIYHRATQQASIDVSLAITMAAVPPAWRLPPPAAHHQPSAHPFAAWPRLLTCSRPAPIHSAPCWPPT